MSDSNRAWPAEFSAQLREALERCTQGQAPASVAAMQILMSAASEAELASTLRQIEAWVDGQPPGEETGRLRAAIAVIRDRPQAWSVTRAVLAEAAHDRPATTAAQDLAHWAGVFDRAVCVSPEGSVALYSLGDPALLRAATDEVVARLRDWGLVGGDRAMLDLGCGIGRFVGALAPQMRFVVGVDISHEMLRVARDRCVPCPNAAFLRVGGGDLAMLGDGRFDLVLGADVFPYLFASRPALAERLMAEVARVLKPGGDLVILNLSYRNDLDADRRDLAAIADRHGLTVRRSGTQDLELWDAQTFHLVKANSRFAARPLDSADEYPGKTGGD